MSLEAEINFCLNFLKTLDSQKLSVYSPASLLNALTLLYIGSSGETAEELSKIVGGKDQTKAAIIDYYSKLFKRHKYDNIDIEDLSYLPPEKKLKKDAKQDLDVVENSEYDAKDDKSDKHEDDAENDEEVSDDEELYSSEEEDTTPSSKMIIANRLFVSEKIKVKKAFEELLNETFDDKIEKVDFNNEAATEKVNLKEV
uniref:Serpin domain-containing protein n=1 Tax=Panagrolaimus sp. PS1159 TaxID=55785 RepID=A0AC35G0U8_9BILA